MRILMDGASVNRGGLNHIENLEVVQRALNSCPTWRARYLGIDSLHPSVPRSISSALPQPASALNEKCPTARATPKQHSGVGGRNHSRHTQELQMPMDVAGALTASITYCLFPQHTEYKRPSHSLSEILSRMSTLGNTTRGPMNKSYQKGSVSTHICRATLSPNLLLGQLRSFLVPKQVEHINNSRF